MKKRVGILTSGGDCPGLNATIRGVAKALYARMGDNVEIVGILNGYSGLINGDYKEMSEDDFRGILTLGGTILGTKRTPFKMMRVVEDDNVDKVAAMKKTYKDAKLDCLLCLGGNGTHKTANLLSQEGLNIIGLPKIRGLARKPLVLLRDDGRNEKSAVESLSQEDACYLIRQATLEDMLQELRVPAHRPAESLEKRCERIYRSWGLSTYDANKRYLTGALRMMMGSDHRLAIRKEILGPVAEEYNLTVAAVDSALRRLLETLDETGTQTWRDFRKEYGLERRKVTIGRLLYALESKLSQQ